MLRLYLYPPIIGHKSCNVLSLLTLLTLQKKWQHLVTNNVFWIKKVKSQQQNKKSNIKSLPELGIEPLAPKADALQLHHCVN